MVTYLIRLLCIIGFGILLAACGQSEEKQTPAEPPQLDMSVPSTNHAILKAGKAAYETTCATSCHRKDGGGMIGPNLTDDYFIYGSSFQDLMTMIEKGSPAKGMPANDKRFSPRKRYAIASYVWTLRGTTPEDPKPPEGKKVESGE